MSTENNLATLATLFDGTNINLASGTVTATSFSGAGTGLTGTASSLSIGGSAGSAPAGSLTGTTLSGGITASSLQSVGTISSGTWSASFGAVSGANLTGLTAGNLSGTIPSGVLGNSTAYVGTTAIALNRGSANQQLTGVNLNLYAGTASQAPLYITSGTNLTTAAAGAVEYDGNMMYGTGNTTNGRGLIPICNYFYLSSNLAATATTISPFFGSNSSIPLVTSGIYEIEFYCWFTKTTAGTLVWTLTNSTTVTNLSVQMEMSPIAGVTSTPAASQLQAQMTQQTAAAVAFAATGSLTTAVNHYARFKVMLINGSSTSIRLNVTNSAGTVTPLTGSYWKATRIASVGTYAA